SESVVEPGTPAVEPAPSQGSGPERTIFALPDAIAFALRNSPRLRSARAAIERARGQEQVAFAPFLPQVDLLGQYGVVSDTLAPGIAGNVGFILANGSGTRSYAQTELGLQWTLYDFGRTGGRYRQAVARGHIAELQLLRAAQTVEFDLARLNNVMGRNAAWPLEVIDLEVRPPLRGLLGDLLERSAAERPEVGLARQAVAAAQEGSQAARGEFLPKIFVRAALGRTDGKNVITGWQEGAGLHVEAPLYSGGRHRGELRSAEADVEGALADAQTILDAISLQVNLAYRGAVAASERIDLSRTAVVQAEENLRLIRVRYRNGNATPTDIVDSETALTRSQQRFFSATYTYLAALARLD